MGRIASDERNTPDGRRTDDSIRPAGVHSSSNAPSYATAYGTESEIGTGHTAANKLWAAGQHSNAVIGCRTLNEALNEAVGCGEDHPFLKKVLLLNGLSLSLAQGLITAARDGCR